METRASPEGRLGLSERPVVSTSAAVLTLLSFREIIMLLYFSITHLQIRY
jgi:hypothetical protein